jgi:hypothetical protein
MSRRSIWEESLPPNVDVPRKQKLRDEPLPPNVDAQRGWFRSAAVPSVEPALNGADVASEGGTLVTDEYDAGIESAAPPAPGSGDGAEPQPEEPTELLPEQPEEEAAAQPKTDRGPLGFGILPGVRGRIDGLRRKKG